MALGIGSTSTSSLFALSALRKHENSLMQTMAQLSSGKRLVSGAIDPSGLAISQQFQTQISGSDVAIGNAQDTINLTRTADSALSSQGDMLGRMRDLALRSANDATMTASDRATLNNEFQSLNAELTRQGQATNFNTKPLTTDVAGQQYGTQAAQVGPNNTPNDQINVTINPSTAQTLGPAGNEMNTQDITTTAGAQNAISAIDQAMDQVNNQRANLGVTERRFQYAVNDQETTKINMAAANSRMADTNMAETITKQSKTNLLTQISMGMLSQSNAQSFGVMKLLGMG